MMTFLKTSSALIALLLGATSCVTISSNTPYPAPPEINEALRKHIAEHEAATGLQFRGDFIAKIVPTTRADFDGYAIAKSPLKGAEAVGWVMHKTPFEVFFAKIEGKSIPDRVLHHEALHLVLASNGIPGHPERYADQTWRWSDQPAASSAWR